jgi:hypothetical protein
MTEIPTYHFAPRHESGVLGLARSQVAAGCVGVVFALVAVLGARQPLAGLGCIGLAAVVTFTPIGGRPLVSWFGALSAQLIGHRHAAAPLARAQLRSGRGVEMEQHSTPIRWHLPGVGRLVIRPVPTALGEVGVADISGANRSASITFTLSGPRFGLTDPDEQARALGSWGQLLGALARESKELKHLQLTERLVPDDLAAQWHFLASLGSITDPSARRIYQSELESLAGQAVRHEVLLTATLGRSGRDQQAIATECTHLVDLFDASGFVARPLSAVALARELRSILDPESTIGELDGSDRLDGELEAARHAPRSWRSGWASIRTDASWHASFEASGLPRLPVGPEWAWPLVLAEQPLERRALALHLELARPDLAIKRAERAVISEESDEAMRERWGFRSGARHEQSHGAALDREVELATGFADARFSLLVTVSATSEEELSTCARTLVSQGAQSHIELRRLYGRQAEALVATLPLGILRFGGGWR